MGSLWGEGVALVQPDRPVGRGGGNSYPVFGFAKLFWALLQLRSLLYGKEN